MTSEGQSDVKIWLSAKMTHTAADCVDGAWDEDMFSTALKNSKEFYKVWFGQLRLLEACVIWSNVNYDPFKREREQG